jgi:FkbM family methyltransferase
MVMLSDATTTNLEVIESKGVKLPIDPSVMSEHLQEVIRAGHYEKGEAKHLTEIVEPGERVLELGGGIGFLSALIGLTGRAEKIAVVEANPALIPLIRMTHRLNGVDAEVIHGAAVADLTATVLRFSIDVDFWASSLKPRKSKGVKSVIEVPAVALQTLLKIYRPTFMIVDVEGSEVDLLCGTADLGSVKKLIVEVHEKAIGPAGIKRLFDGMSAAGFYMDVRSVQPGVVLFRRLPE